MLKIGRPIQLKEYPPHTSAEYMPGEAYVRRQNRALENKLVLAGNGRSGLPVLLSGVTHGYRSTKVFGLARHMGNLEL